MRRARRSFTPWSRETRERFDALGLPARPDPLRAVLPSRNDALGLVLPVDAAWERWGRQAVVVRVRDAVKVKSTTCTTPSTCASASARASSSSCTTTRPRSISARSARSSTGRDAAAPAPCTCLPLAVSRLEWARNASDLLDLVEETSLRGNPVRGPRAHHVVEPVLEPRAARLGSPCRDARRALGGRDGASALRQVVARARGRAPSPRALGVRRPRGVPSRDRVRQRPVARRRRHPALGLRPAHRLGARPLSAGEGPRSAHRRSRRGGADARRSRSLHGVRPVRRRTPCPRCCFVLDELEQVLAMDASRAGQALDVLADPARTAPERAGREPVARAAPHRSASSCAAPSTRSCGRRSERSASSRSWARSRRSASRASRRRRRRR